MEPGGLDLAYLVVTAVSGALGALLTYLATRRQSQISEKAVYIKAVDKLTTGLRAEIDRLNADRAVLLRQIAALEVRDREQSARLEQIERERVRLHAALQRRVRGGLPEGD